MLLNHKEETGKVSPALGERDSRAHVNHLSKKICFKLMLTCVQVKGCGWVGEEKSAKIRRGW